MAAARLGERRGGDCAVMKAGEEAVQCSHPVFEKTRTVAEKRLPI